MGGTIMDIHPAAIDGIRSALKEFKDEPDLRRVVVEQLSNGFTSDFVLQGAFGPKGDRTHHTVSRIISPSGDLLARYEGRG